MLVIAILMGVILAICGLLAAFVAFPHRGEQMPAAPWLGEAMARVAGAAPTLDEDDVEHASTR